MPATNKSGYTVYEYLSYAAQHPGWDTVYGSMTTQCRGRIGVHWRTNGNQFTVESLDTSVNAIWGNGWYRGGVHVSLAIGGQFLTVVDPGGGTVCSSIACQNQYGIAEAGPVFTDTANRSLPRTWTITNNNTTFEMWFGGTLTPYPPSNYGGFTIQDYGKLNRIGGDNIDIIPVILEYFPFAVNKNGWKTCDRSGGGVWDRNDGGGWDEKKNKQDDYGFSKAYINRGTWTIADRIGS